LAVGHVAGANLVGRACFQLLARAAGRRCGLAVLLAVAAIAQASAQDPPPRPFNPFDFTAPSYPFGVGLLLDDADDVVDDAWDITHAMEHVTTCLDPARSKEFVREASEMYGTLSIVRSKLETAAAQYKDTPVRRGLRDPWLVDLDLGPASELRYHIKYIDEVADAMTKALQALKPCPEEPPVHSIVGPNGPVNPPPVTPEPPVPPPPHKPEICKACHAIIVHIEFIDAKILNLEHSQAGLRKYANLADPRIQRALRDDDARIDALKAERARLEIEKAECEKKCFGGTGYLGGWYLGGELAETFGREHKTERPVGSDVTTFESTESGDPPGLGIVVGYNFVPWNSRIVVGPFASFDWLRQTINHNFAGGRLLGSTTQLFINTGVKAGVAMQGGLYLYGLAGAAFLNHDLNVNFATAASSNVTTPGFTAGFGAEYHPHGLRIAGQAVSLFAQYQHTWWDTANFNQPSSSPAFNYAFKREDDTVRFGVLFHLDAPPGDSGAHGFPPRPRVLK
jgi:hypothetical protein